MAEHSGPDRTRVIFALAAVYIIWGSTYLGMRYAIETIPPFLMAGARFVLAGGAMMLILRLRGAALPTAAQWRGAALTGGLLIMVGNGGVVFAEQYVASSLAALVAATVPIWAALLTGIWGEWPRRAEWLGLALGFAGVVVLNADGDLRGSPIGALSLLIGAVGWAFGTVVGRRVILPDGLMASAAQMLCGGAMVGALGLAVGDRITAMPSAVSLAAFAYLVVFGAVGFSAYTFLVRSVRPALVTSYAYVNPIVAVALGVLLAGERLGTTALAALPLIVGGVALVVLARGRAAPAPAPQTAGAGERA